MSMNEEEFASFLWALENTGLAWAVDDLRARDTAQREALARVEAERDAVHSAMRRQSERHDELLFMLELVTSQRDTAQAQLAQAVGLLQDGIDRKSGWSEIAERFIARHAQAEQQEAKPTAEQLAALKRFYETCTDGEAYDVPVETMHQLAAMDLVDPAPEHGEHGFSMNAKGRAALASKQEAQGAQAGDFWTWLDFAYRDGSKGEGRNFTKYNMEVAYRAGTEAARAALATQPAAGEPFAWIVESPKDLEPVTSVCKHKDQADRFKSMRWTVTPVYAAPPAAAHGVLPEPKDPAEYRGSSSLYAKGWNDCLNNLHGNEGVRKDAQRYRWLRHQEAEHGVSVLNVGSWPLPATCIALTYPDAEAVDAAIDAAMRAQGDGE